MRADLVAAVQACALPIVIVWQQVTELVCASVAVQVRCVLLTSLPLTPRLASTNVTVRLVSHVSLNTGVPKAGAAGHWMVADAGQLVTDGALLTITVIVWLQVTELVCASVAVQVRCVLLPSLPLTPAGVHERDRKSVV